jgi:hypothetical protein
MTPESKLVYLEAELKAIEAKEESFVKRRLEIMIEMEDLKSSIGDEL